MIRRSRICRNEVRPLSTGGSRGEPLAVCVDCLLGALAVELVEQWGRGSPGRVTSSFAVRSPVTVGVRPARVEADFALGML
jgi:hypothetical protein